MSETSASCPLRVMRIITRLNIGGPAIQAIEMTARLNRAPDQSWLVCGTIDANEGDLAYLAKLRGVKLIVIPALGRAPNPLRDLFVIWRLYRLVRQLKPNVVHTHTAKAGFTGRIAAHLAGVPVIVHTFHGHVFHGYFGRLRTGLFIGLERWLGRISTKIATLSPRLADDLVQTYRIAEADKVSVIPLGLDLDIFRHTERGSGHWRQSARIPSNSPLIGIVGRLVPIKNHLMFVKAAREVADRYPDARFIIVGDGESREMITAEIMRLFPDSPLRPWPTSEDSDQTSIHPFILTGWVRELAPIYAELDLLVVCSDNEGTPVALIESMASGCPVVATAVGGVPDLLDNGRLGQLIPPNSSEALASAISDHINKRPASAEAIARTAAIRSEICDRFALSRLEIGLRNLYRDQF